MSRKRLIRILASEVKPATAPRNPPTISSTLKLREAKHRIVQLEELLMLLRLIQPQFSMYKHQAVMDSVAIDMKPTKTYENHDIYCMTLKRFKDI